MEYRIQKKKDFTLIGYGAFGSWNDGVNPIPKLWEKAATIVQNSKTCIIGVCLPPRADEYFYSCGFEMEDYKSIQIPEGMIAHTFPEHEYAVFRHNGNVKHVMSTYFEIWKTFDAAGLQMAKGMPEIETSTYEMIGREEDDDYEMEIWIPIINESPETK